MQDQEHPFIAWWAGLSRLDAVSHEGKDFILTDLGGKRFALGTHGDMPLLCWLPDDRQAMESMNWTSAAIAYGLRSRDWIALSSSDIRVRGSSALNPVQARLFVPVTLGRLSPWKEKSPSRLAVGHMKLEKGRPSFSGEPYKVLPLKLLGA